MSYHHHRFMTPGGSRKRKEREAFYSVNKPFGAPAQQFNNTASKCNTEPFYSNRLLAGYMAYEFLTRGTLLGEKFDPARREALALGAAGSMEVKKFWKEGADSAEPGGGGGKMKGVESYAEVASILKSEEAHIPGVVNPSQLSRWIQM